MKRLYFPHEFKLTKLNEPVRPPRHEASAKMAGNFMRPLEISKLGLERMHRKARNLRTFGIIL